MSHIYSTLNKPSNSVHNQRADCRLYKNLSKLHVTNKTRFHFVNVCVILEHKK